MLCADGERAGCCCCGGAWGGAGERATGEGLGEGRGGMKRDAGLAGGLGSPSFFGTMTGSVLTVAFSSLLLGVGTSSFSFLTWDDLRIAGRLFDAGKGDVTN